MSNLYAQEARTQSTKVDNTPAIAAIRGRETEMGQNNGGGVSFLLDDLGIFKRFLMIGVTNGTYSPSIKGVSAVKAGFDLTKNLAQKDPEGLVSLIVEVSTSGRAPKNDPAIAALAIAATIKESAEFAFNSLGAVCRTGTHLFQFIEIYNSLGKWNALAKRSIAAWYNGRTPDRLAVQLLKYQSRNGWDHRDVLRLAHVKPATDVHNSMYRYTTAKTFAENLPSLYEVVRKLNAGDLTSGQVITLIETNPTLTWEMIPTKYLGDQSVLQALLPTMGPTALIRKLGIMTGHGVFDSTVAAKLAADKLTNSSELHKQRVHPITIYAAFKQYNAGRGNKGSAVWSPSTRISTALDDAFYAAFKPSVDTGEGYLVGVDVSGSMYGASVLGMDNMTAAEVATIMSMAAVREQSNAEIIGFGRRMVQLGIKSDMSLQAATAKMRGTVWDGSSTNLGEMFEYALANKTKGVDKFIAITDNDINSGRQPAVLLKEYRNKSGRNSKFAVIATSLSNFTVADPKDADSIDIAGFDSAAPTIIADL